MIGKEGTFTLAPTFINATEVSLNTPEEDITLRFPYKDNDGFRYDIEHAGTCDAQGILNSQVMPLSETLTLAKTMDRLREQCGFPYPADKESS